MGMQNKKECPLKVGFLMVLGTLGKTFGMFEKGTDIPKAMEEAAECDEDCAWYYGDECAIKRIAHLYTKPFSGPR
jgi:hypothetical protein